MVVPEAPQNLIGDNTYDSDRFDTELRFYRVEVMPRIVEIEGVRLGINAG